MGRTILCLEARGAELIPMEQDALSIIVPLAPNDRLNRELAGWLEAVPEPIQVVISTTAESAQDLPANAVRVSGSPGRGRQLNRGARAASGLWLWFIHADCTPRTDALERVLQFIEPGTPRLGYCRLRFADDGPKLSALNALGANLRSRLFGLPYGDQGLCLPARWLRQFSGFREDLERGEDLDLVVRARTAGLPIRPIGTTLVTSARRYLEQGWLKTTWRHQCAAIRLIRNARQDTRSDRP